MIRYRVKLTPDDNDTFLVTSPDFPEVITFGETREEALHYAVGAFREIIAGKIYYKQPIPTPSKIRAKDDFITLPLQTEMKVRLYQSLIESGIKKADLARKMKIHRQEIDRLFDSKQAISLSKFESAFAALGKTLNIEVTNTP
jgi:antitoxin HicB